MAQIKKLQSGGSVPQNTPDNTIQYKGVTFDKNALVEGYKNYLKTTAQNNVTGFDQSDQYKDIDEHLNNRLTSLKNTNVINENPTFTTAPTEINGITGLNTFLNPKDKSKSQQFENEAFYNYLNKSVELNKTSTPTQPTKEYHRFHSIKGSLTGSEFGGNPEGFNTAWASKDYTIDKKKELIKNALTSELTKFKNAGNKEIIGIDPEVVNKLKAGDADKYINEIKTADDSKLSEIAGHLGMNSELSDLLYIPKTETDIANETEAKRLADNEVINHQRTLDTWAANKKLREVVEAENHKRTLATWDLNKKKREDVIKKLVALKKPEDTTINKFFEGKADTADYLEAGATAADVASLAGGVVGVGAGLTGTGLQLAADITKGAGGWDIAKNLGMNLGFTALALLPGVGGGAKAAYKASKLAKEGLEAAKILKGADKILDGVKVAEEVVKASKVAGAAVDTRKVLEAEKLLESASTIKKSEVIAEKVIKDGLKNNKFAGKLVENPLLNKAASAIKTTAVIGGIQTGINAVGQTYKDISQSKKQGLSSLGDITIKDVRGLTAGIAGTKGLYHGIISRVGTTNKTISEAGTNVKLKNVPEGLEEELKTIKIPKGKDVKEAINEHVDNQIKLKKDEVNRLNTDTETPHKEIISKLEKLDQDIAALESSKGKITIDNGKLGNKWVGRQLGAGKVKEKTEKVLKTEVDESSLVPKWLQQHAINKVSKPANEVTENSNTAINELEKSNKEYLKSLKRNKVKEEWDKRPKKEVIEEVPIKKESIPQENPLSKRIKPLPEVSNEQKVLNKKNAMEALQRKRETGKIAKNKNGGVMKYELGKPIIFNRTASNDINPWESDEYKNDPEKKIAANWTQGTKSNSLVYTFNSPKLSTTKEAIVIGKKPITPAATVPNNLITGTLKVASPLVNTQKQNTINIPSLAEPFKYLVGQATNAANLKTSIEHLTPVLETPFEKTFAAKNWLPITASYNKAAIDTQRLASRPITSDASLALAGSLEGANKANDLRATGNEKAWEVQEGNKQGANEIANENAASRLNTANKNAQTMAAYSGVIGNLISGKRVQDYKNLTNFVNATTQATSQRNLEKHGYDVAKQQQSFIDEYNNSDWKQLQKQLENEYGTEGENWANSKEGIDYVNSQKGAIGNEKVSWTASPQYKLYNERIKSLNKTLTDKEAKARELVTLKGRTLNDYYDPTGVQFNLPKGFPSFNNKKAIFKSGGTLSAGEKYELEVLKLKQKDKDNNNKNYQKTLDRTDKNTSKVLDGLSKEKLMLLKTVLGTK